MQVLFSSKYAIRGRVFQVQDISDNKPWEKEDYLIPLINRIQEEALRQNIDVAVRPENLVDEIPGTSSFNQVFQGIIVFTNENAPLYRVMLEKARNLWKLLIKTEQGCQLEPNELVALPSPEEFKEDEEKFGKETEEWLNLMRETTLTAENALDESGQLTFSLANGQPLK